MIVQTQKRTWGLWLVLGLVLAVLLVLFAREVTQLSLPGLDVSPKTLGYPDPTLDDINDVLKFSRKALKLNC